MVLYFKFDKIMALMVPNRHKHFANAGVVWTPHKITCSRVHTSGSIKPTFDLQTGGRCNEGNAHQIRPHQKSLQLLSVLIYLIRYPITVIFLYRTRQLYHDAHLVDIIDERHGEKLGVYIASKHLLNHVILALYPLTFCNTPYMDWKKYIGLND